MTKYLFFYWNITKVLESPENLKAFEGKVGQKWAKEIIIDYYSRSPIRIILIILIILMMIIRTEEGWLLGPMVKILTIMAKQNPTPGGLSRWSFFLASVGERSFVFLQLIFSSSFSSYFSPTNLFFLQLILSGGVLQGWAGRGKKSPTIAMIIMLIN